MQLIYRQSAIEKSNAATGQGIFATNAMCDDGLSIDMAGLDISRFQSGHAHLLKNHDPDKVMARLTRAWKTQTKAMAEWAWPSPGINAHSDEARSLVGEGFYSLSFGFAVLETKPAPGGGRIVTKSEALEVSLVSVPMDVGAVITARSKSRAGKVLSALNANKLRKAHAAAQRCIGHLEDVLANADAADPEGEIEETSEEARDFRLRQLETRRLASPDFARRQRQLTVLRLVRHDGD